MDDFFTTRCATAVEPPHAQQGRGNTRLSPSRRDLVRSIMAVAIFPAWTAGRPSTHDILLVNGWILTKADLH